MSIHIFFVSDHIATKIPAHTHEFFQLIYCKSGKGYITIGDSAHKTITGTVYLAKPGVIHAIDNFEGLDLLEMKFFAHGTFAEKLKSLPDIFSISENPVATELLASTIREGLMKKEYFNESSDATGMLFFIEVIRYLNPSSKPAGMRTFATLDTVKEAREDIDIMILNLRSFIEKNLAGAITLDTLAEQVHFNKTYFVKRFKSLWGVSPMKYVGNIRLEHARELLIFSHLSISDIALRTGFNTAHYFSRKFKEQYGISPQSYRAQYKKR